MSYSADTFWGNVRKETGPDGCWLWVGKRMTRPGGYGRVRFDGKDWVATRFLWQVILGRKRTPGTNILHRCDTPACVRPEHLFEGTQRENMLDCKLKGRLSPLPRRTKVTAEDVVEIRRLYAGGVNQPTLAKRFGLKQPQVSAIVLGQSWKDIPMQEVA